MQSAHEIVTLQVRVPENSDQFVFTLGLTRTQDIEAVIDPAPMGPPLWLNDLTFSARWASSLLLDSIIEVTLRYTGEPPCIIECQAPEPLRSVNDGDWAYPRSNEEWADVVARREEMTRNKPVQAFFHNLDRLTHIKLIPMCPELCEKEKDLRLKHITALSSTLCDRLRLRWTDEEPDRDLDRAAVSHVCNIFSDQIGQLERTVGRECAGEAFVDFAAGELMLSVPFQRVRSINYYIAGDPDSFFVFLFAELGFAALECDCDCELWMRLLPDLIRMQAYYVARFSKVKALNEYRIHREKLSPAQRDRVNQSLPQFPSDELELRRMHIKSVRAAAPCFHNPVERDPI